MARRPRKAKQTTDERIPETIFDSLDAHDPAKQAEKKGDGPTTAELMAQLAQMSERVDAAERALAYESVRSSAPVVVAPQPQPEALKEPMLNMDGLPDPVTQGKEYAAEIARRTISFQQEMADFQNKRREAATPRPMGDPDALWEDFGDAYSDYAGDPDRISFVAGQLVKKLSKRGVDAQAYMFRQSDRFFKDLVKEYDKVFGKPGQEDDEEVDEIPAKQRGPRKAASPVDEEADGRDEAIPGGSGPFGGAPRIERAPAGDMIRDIHDMQRKSGYY